ncbi:MAG: hypothetical protein KDD51_08725 [Bdellovibrionales bacterium]|nr:hypothetical protein [Bdellovibrionales bacterium]
MKTFIATLGLVALLGSVTAPASPSCKDYWEARKSGHDWSGHASLSQFDSLCASNVVIAKNWNGLCGVHVLSSAGYPTQFHGVVPAIAISWFDCHVGDKDLSFGDYVDGTTAEICRESCEKCATGPRIQCAYVFTPKSE